MSRAPFAEWVGPTPNRTPGGMRRPIRGLVLHITEGAIDGAQSWLKNPKSQASAHFLNPKVGPLRQLVDTDDRAWAQASGNLNWVSVENEGHSGELLTVRQQVNAATLVRWLHDVENVPLVVSDTPATPGLGWHGMGGKAWGGHPDCPGAPVIGQRHHILELAEGVPMARFPKAVDACWSPNGGVWVLGSDGGVGAFGGAPFVGSYPGLAPDQRLGERTFLRIVPSIRPGKQYDLLADDGNVFSF